MELEKDQTQKQTTGHIYFFEREADKKIIDVDEYTASTMMYHTADGNRVHKFKYLGSSTGEHFKKRVEEIKIAGKEIEKEVKEKTNDMEQFSVTKNKLKYTDLLEADDPKLKKVTEIIEKLEEELDELKQKQDSLRQDVFDKAFKEELEHIDADKMPRNFKGKSDNGVYNFGDNVGGYNINNFLKT